jgi:hypothetical protein
LQYLDGCVGFVGSRPLVVLRPAGSNEINIDVVCHSWYSTTVTALLGPVPAAHGPGHGSPCPIRPGRAGLHPAVGPPISPQWTQSLSLLIRVLSPSLSEQPTRPLLLPVASQLPPLTTRFSLPECKCSLRPFSQTTHSNNTPRPELAFTS